MYDMSRNLIVMLITHSVLGDAQRSTPRIVVGSVPPLDHLGLIKYD